MRALSVWRPWPWLIAHGFKRLENRTWKPPRSILGKAVALYSTKGQSDRRTREHLRTEGWQIPQDTPVGISVVCRVSGHVESKAEIERHWEDPAERALQKYWYQGGIAWILEAVEVLSEPVPVRGRSGLQLQGLWVPDDDLLSAIDAAQKTPARTAREAMLGNRHLAGVLASFNRTTGEPT